MSGTGSTVSKHHHDNVGIKHESNEIYTTVLSYRAITTQFIFKAEI